MIGLRLSEARIRAQKEFRKREGLTPAPRARYAGGWEGFKNRLEGMLRKTRKFDCHCSMCRFYKDRPRELSVQEKRELIRYYQMLQEI